MRNKSEEWPSCLDESDIKFLTAVAERFKADGGALLNSDMRRDAKALMKQAGSLLDKLEKFASNYTGVAFDADCSERAEERLGGFDLSEDELRLARAGFSKYGMQFPIIGMQAHMFEILKSFPGKNGRPKNWQREWLLEQIQERFIKRGLPAGRHSNDFKQTEEIVMRLAGLEK